MTAALRTNRNRKRPAHTAPRPTAVQISARCTDPIHSSVQNCTERTAPHPFLMENQVRRTAPRPFCFQECLPCSARRPALLWANFERSVLQSSSDPNRARRSDPRPGSLSDTRKFHWEKTTNKKPAARRETVESTPRWRAHSPASSRCVALAGGTWLRRPTSARDG